MVRVRVRVRVRWLGLEFGFGLGLGFGVGAEYYLPSSTLGEWMEVLGAADSLKTTVA